MKQPKKLTRAHKEFLRKCNLDPKYWMLLSEDQHRYVYINKIDGNTRERLKHPSRE